MTENANRALRDAKTCELVDELARREAVEETRVEPYVDMEFSVNGPARVLVVTD